jgi:hypothetical protein
MAQNNTNGIFDGKSNAGHGAVVIKTTVFSIRLTWQRSPAHLNPQD